MNVNSAVTLYVDR